MHYVAVIASETPTYLRSTSGRRAPEGVHGGKALRLYGRRRASTGSAVGVAREPLVHLPAGTERESDTCSDRGERDVTCSGRAAAHTRRLLKEKYCRERMTGVIGSAAGRTQ